jgi:hypothetical protein
MKLGKKKKKRKKDRMKCNNSKDEMKILENNKVISVRLDSKYHPI